MNNLQLLSSILHYNSCTKDETKLKPNHFIVTIPWTQEYRWWKSFVQTQQHDSMDDKYWIYMQHIYMYTYRLNTCREQYMVNIILCREHEMKTIINTITVHISAATISCMRLSCASSVKPVLWWLIHHLSDESPAILNVILRSLSVNYGSGVVNAAPFDKRRWRLLIITEPALLTRCACNIWCSPSIHIPLQCSTVWMSANRMSGCRITVSPVSVSDRVQYIWGWWGACVVLLVRVQFSLVVCGKNLSYLLVRVLLMVTV